MWPRRLQLIVIWLIWFRHFNGHQSPRGRNGKVSSCILRCIRFYSLDHPILQSKVGLFNVLVIFYGEVNKKVNHQ